MSFFLCLKNKKESNREVSAPTGEKVPRMAPKANADGPEGANTTFATGGLRLPLELYKKNKSKRHLFGCLFLCLKKQKESNREVSAPTGEKVPRMAPNNLAKA